MPCIINSKDNMHAKISENIPISRETMTNIPITTFPSHNDQTFVSFFKYTSSTLTRIAFFWIRTGNPDLRSPLFFRVLQKTATDNKGRAILSPTLHFYVIVQTRVSLSMLNRVHVLSSLQKTDKRRSPSCTVSSLAYNTDLCVISYLFFHQYVTLCYDCHTVFFKFLFVSVFNAKFYIHMQRKRNK